MPAHITVVGAGIAGLATAVALRGAGYDITVLEQRTDAASSSSGAGISIWPNALAALDEIGLGDAVRAAGGRVTGGAIRWRDGTWLRRPTAQRIVDALGEPLVVVRRSALIAVLRAALPGDAVHTGVTTTSVEIGGSVPRVHVAGGEIRETDAVIGADGVNSVVARSLNGPLRSRYAGYTAWRGVAAHRLDQALAGETMGWGTEVGHVPLDDEHTYWFVTERTSEGGSASGGERAYLSARLASWADPIPQLIAATASADLLRNDLYDHQQPEHWSRGPVVIVGDAAHPMRPHLGQGGCQALEDAVILSRFTGLCPDLPTAFARFSEFRRQRVRPLVRESMLIGRVVNLRPVLLGGLASRATALIPERAVTRHLATIASRSAFVPPSAADIPR